MTTKTKRESLKTRLAIIRRAGGPRCGLDGCPVGGWGETQQALRQLAEDLPLKSERTYSVQQVVDALYDVDSAGRYRVRAN